MLLTWPTWPKVVYPRPLVLDRVPQMEDSPGQDCRGEGCKKFLRDLGPLKKKSLREEDPEVALAEEEHHTDDAPLEQ